MGAKGCLVDGLGGEHIPTLSVTSGDSRKQRKPQFPFLPEPQAGPLLPSPLCPSQVPVLPPKPQFPILVTPNSTLSKVFIRLTAFVFPFLLIKSGNVGKKYGRVTGFLMVPHLKCILKYVNQ